MNMADLSGWAKCVLQVLLSVGGITHHALLQSPVELP